MMMIGLRTMWGVDLQQTEGKFSDYLQEEFQKNIAPKLETGILIIENGHLKIPEKHWFLADGIASDLFIL